MKMTCCKEFTFWNDNEWRTVIYSAEITIRLAPKRRICVRRLIFRYISKYVNSRNDPIAMFCFGIREDSTRYVHQVSGNIIQECPNNCILQQDKTPPKFFCYTAILKHSTPWPPMLHRFQSYRKSMEYFKKQSSRNKSSYHWKSHRNYEWKISEFIEQV